MNENIRIALNSLSANKLRAALTMLGIMIGVAAVITLLAIGDGVTRFVADQFIGLGANLVFVVPEADFDNFNAGGEPLAESSLTMEDAELLNDPAVVPGVARVAPLIMSNADFQMEGTSYRTQVRATTPDYAAVRSYRVERGRFITQADYDARSRVVVLGPETVAALYPEAVDPLETDVRIRGIPFRVVGVLESKGASAFGGSQDDLAIVPLTTAQDRLFSRRDPLTGEMTVDAILLQAVDGEAVDDVLIDVTGALRIAHEIAFRDEDDFLVLTQQDFLNAFGQITSVLTLFLGAIASISLLVGGIGIMNIMLVSVTERTREIGLRKAVGARRLDILGQFLTEAVILALLGGLLGIGLGALGAAAIHLFVPTLETPVTFSSVLLAAGFSALVGLFFGIYPAARAAALHPIEALRFE